MRAFAYASALAALRIVSANPTQTLREPPTKRGSLPTISVSGNAFWANGDRFYVRGIDYQPGGSSANVDPLANPDICKRDIPYFQKLGINTVRVYAIDNSQSHDECMQALSDAGIYVVADVNNDNYSINRDDPEVSYNADYLQSVFSTVQMMAQYDNTMAFFSGNEVINNDVGSEKCAPYVKAVQRDIKSYMSAQGLRPVLVGYSAADVDSNRMQTAQYMNCGSDAVRGDFFAFNDYSWCDSNFQTSGWDQKVKNFTDYGIPIFLSEWGCITNRPRTFEEMAALMNPEMTSVYSGGLLYEYSNEANDYGIVKISGDSVSTLDEFSLYAKVLSQNPEPTGDGGAASTTHAVACPTSDSSWPVNPTMIPEMPSQANQYLQKGAGTGPGLKGDGSQQAGDSGTATASVNANTDATATSSAGTSDGDDSAGVSIRGTLSLGPVLVSATALVFTLCGALLL